MLTWVLLRQAKRLAAQGKRVVILTPGAQGRTDKEHGGLTCRSCRHVTLNGGDGAGERSPYWLVWIRVTG